MDMDPVQKVWMYQNWIADQKDKAELAKNQAYLIGSFWNPEAVKSLVDDSGTISSSEEEFDESTRMVLEGVSILPDNNQNNNEVRKRRRRSIKE